MDFKDFMEGMPGTIIGPFAIGGEETVDCSKNLSTSDAVAALQAGLVAYTTAHRFEPGDLIVQKDGIASVSVCGARDGHPAIFVRYEAEPGEFDRLATLRSGSECWTSRRCDCLVGWIGHDGAVVVSAVHADNYEPFNLQAALADETAELLR